MNNYNILTHDVMVDLENTLMSNSKDNWKSKTLRFKAVGESGISKLWLLGNIKRIESNDFWYRETDTEIIVYSSYNIKIENCNRIYGNPIHSNVLDIEKKSNGAFMGSAFKRLDVSGLDTSDMDCMAGLFAFSENDEIVGIDTWDTSHVVDMSYMFYGAYCFMKLNLNGIDTSQVKNMDCMFSKSMIPFNGLENLDTSNLESAVKMFNHYNNINERLGWSVANITLDLSKWNLSRLKYPDYMFNAAIVSKLDISSLDLSKFGNIEVISKACIDEAKTNGFSNLSSGDKRKVVEGSDIPILNDGHLKKWRIRTDGLKKHWRLVSSVTIWKGQDGFSSYTFINRIW